MKKTIIIVIIAVLAVLSSCTPSKKVILPPEEEQPIVEKTANDNENKQTEETAKQPQVTEQLENENPRVTPNPTPAKPKITPKPVKKAETTETSGILPGYVVRVSVTDQKVYVYKDGNSFKTMMCSTGVAGSETPVGDYKINKRGNWFYSSKFQQGGKYWVGFIGTLYLFHSVPMDENQNIIQEEAAKLGTPASHGCVRLSVDDAYWFYKTIPDGTKVEIVK